MKTDGIMTKCPNCDTDITGQVKRSVISVAATERLSCGGRMDVPVGCTACGTMMTMRVDFRVEIDEAQLIHNVPGLDKDEVERRKALRDVKQTSE